MSHPGVPDDPLVIPASGGAYPVVVRRGALADLPALLRRHAPAPLYAVVSDATVGPLHGAAVAESIREQGTEAFLTTFPAGERHKTRDTWARTTDALLEGGLGRDGVVVAVGGGVTTDLAGFVAATFMRGVGVVQVPTSLVAMIDAAVGGKTGVDHPRGKNLVGAFHAPRLVVCDAEVVRTLPREERAQGLVEAVKHGAIRDADHLDEVADEAPRLLEGEPAALERVVRRSVRIKAEVVARDEREAGLREVLNFGHTLGHALEAAWGYGVGHGTAVGVGMVLEARLGERLGVTAPGASETLARVVKDLDLPVEVGEASPPAPEVEALLRFLRADKKGREGLPRCVLLARVGEVASAGDGRWSHPVPEEVVAAVLSESAEEGSNA